MSKRAKNIVELGLLLATLVVVLLVGVWFRSVFHVPSPYIVTM